MSQFNVGSRVKYSRKFLQGIYAISGPLPFARGKVTSVRDYGDIAVATVDWDEKHEELPKKCVTANLAYEGDAEQV